MTTFSDSPSRQVDVYSLERPVEFIGRDGVERPLGTVIADEYVDEQANAGIRRFHFHPDPSNPFLRRSKLSTGYSLGLGSDQMSFINPADPIRTLLDQGWEIVDQFAGQSGIEIVTLLVFPEAEDREDPITYDRNFWVNHVGPTGMRLAAEVTTSLWIGRMATRIDLGYYRLICTNGLVGEAMGLESLAYRHTVWAGDQFLTDFLPAVDEVTGLPEIALGKPVGDERTINSLARALGRIRDLRTNTETSSPALTTLTERFPVFSNIPVDTLTGFIDQLGMMVDTGAVPHGDIRTGHLLNGYTNVLNAHRDSLSTTQYWNLDFYGAGVIKASRELAAFAQIFS